MMSKIVIPLVALILGAWLLVSWACQWFGDWGTFIVGALLFSGGAFGMLDAFEEHEETNE